MQAGNFGQGAPEVGHIDGCMDKPTHIDVPVSSYEYAPVAGIKPLRTAIANLYNTLYRQEKESQYTWENVCVVPGGRAGLTRVAAAIGNVNVGYFLPEYTAYEQMLSVFKKFVPIPTTLEEENRYHIDPVTISKEISGRGLGVIVASNPRNPTGQVIEGDELKELTKIAKERHTTLVMDEFYSAYIYSHAEEKNGRCVSITEFVEDYPNDRQKIPHVEIMPHTAQLASFSFAFSHFHSTIPIDVNKDPIIVIDGLTKNFRLPGWRICWVLGPKSVVSSMQSAGSFLEGGANHPLQLAALPLLDPEQYRKEAAALQKHFRAKRDYVLKRLKEIGLIVRVEPDATFYIWLDLKDLQEPIDVGLTFFEECLKEKPSHRRELFESPCHHFVRLSFGPPLDELKRGLEGIERVVKKFGFKAKA
ncbi:pyridoxal phosphate-dependent transferase [Endogone sp. FLAS-F59071]|nr:pyridoxal phosphate-dependent transferase [Endogone sp. FLAS-F59071]|eukprot:RUS21376.1 pyridoxal phosphate-dependent transferase [Endogone sp. FLAS-F59071]